MTAIDVNALADHEWVRPVSPGSACGGPLDESDDFFKLRQEVYNESSPTDWEGIAKRARQILTEESRDLEVVAYLAEALFRTEGYSGLATGLESLLALLVHRFDEVHPTPDRKSKRRGVLKIPALRVAALVEYREPDGADALATAGRAHRLAEAIGGVLVEKLGDAEYTATKFDDFIAALSRHGPYPAPASTSAEPAGDPAIEEASSAAMSGEQGSSALSAPLSMRASVSPTSVEGSALQAAARDDGGEPAGHDRATPGDDGSVESSQEPSQEGVSEAPAASAVAPEPALTPRTRRWLVPVAGASPGGPPADDDNDWSWITTNVDSAGRTGPSADPEDKWEKILSLADEIVASRSKDIRVVAYLLEALWRKEGMAGLAEGAEGLAAMYRAFGSELHPLPERAKGRARVGSWKLVVARLAPHIEYGEVVDPKAAATVDRVRNALETLGGALSASMSSTEYDSTGLDDLIAAAGQLKPAPVKQAEAPPTSGSGSGNSSTSSTSSSSGSGTGSGGGGGSSGGGTSEFKNSGAADQAAAAVLSGPFDPADPQLFAVNRALRWARTTSALPTPTPPKTQLMAPSAYRNFMAQRIDPMKATGKHREIAELCEGLFTGGALYWLDLQRLIGESLQALGCRDSLRVVQNSLADLLDRLRSSGQDLTALQFRGGEPFADPATKAWIGGLPGRGGGSAPQTEAPELDLAALQQLVQDGKVGEALGEIQRAASAASDGSASSRIRLHGARLAIDAGRPEVADPILGGLDDLLRNTRACDYDKDLTCELLALRVRVCDQLLARAGAGTRTDVVERRARAIERLSMLDPARVLGLS